MAAATREARLTKKPGFAGIRFCRNQVLQEPGAWPERPLTASLRHNTEGSAGEIGNVVDLLADRFGKSLEEVDA